MTEESEIGVVLTTTEDEPRTVRYQLLAPVEQMRGWQRSAEADGLTFGDWLRAAASHYAARRDAERVGVSLRGECARRAFHAPGRYCLACDTVGA